ncbi:hypothetical protein CPB86DRAFT_802645 [Serendipita vermifera]|nr:hypothetical protein CPB86DRAFT_802645 [Serendipita vermifera]
MLTRSRDCLVYFFGPDSYQNYMPATQPTQTPVCAECKRLKFILSNTRELHEKIEALQFRIKELEAALAQLQSTFTSEPHPLLVKPLTTTTERLQAHEKTPKDIGLDDEELLDTFGSLTVDTEGETVWYGPHAGSEFLIPRKETDTTTNADLDLPIDIILLSRLFPFKNVHDTEEVVRNLVRSYLPSRNVAYESTFSVYRRLSTSPIVWEDFYRTVFDPIYAPGNVPNDQQVAVFFMSMALYVLGDPKRSMYHPDARRYYHLSRVSMSLGEQLFSTFNVIIDDPDGPNTAWGAIGRSTYELVDSAVVVVNLMAIDRDNEEWDKYPEQAERRRRIWWDLVLYETVYGFAMGRPRAIYPASVVSLV